MLSLMDYTECPHETSVVSNELIKTMTLDICSFVIMNSNLSLFCTIVFLETVNFVTFILNML